MYKSELAEALIHAHPEYSRRASPSETKSWRATNSMDITYKPTPTAARMPTILPEVADVGV